MAIAPMSIPSAKTLELANASRRYEVTVTDLPLCCPTPEMTVWNSHPRIYLPVRDDGGETVCPYCAARYVFHDGPGTPAQP